MDTIRNLHKEKKPPEQGIFTEIAKKTGKELSKAVDKGSIFKGIDYDKIDFVPRDILKKNVWKFSVAKNYNDMIRLNNLLLRPDGSIRPWNEFKREALAIVGMSNRYLKTEYDTIIAGAMMSRKWREIQAQKHIFPYVKFIVTMDQHTSEICSPLHNVICKVDDPFLEHYFPPNHFNCRTDVLQLRDAEPTPQKELPFIDIPPAFLNNVGETLEIFTEENAYIQNTPKEVLKEADKLYLKENRQEAMEYADKHLIGKEIVMSNGLNVKINRNGFKHFLQQVHKDYLEKNALTYIMENVLINSVYIKSADDQKGRNQFKYHYYKYSNNMFVVIRELLSNKEVQFYSIVDKLK